MMGTGKSVAHRNLTGSTTHRYRVVTPCLLATILMAGTLAPCGPATPTLRQTLHHIMRGNGYSH